MSSSTVEELSPLLPQVYQLEFELVPIRPAGYVAGHQHLEGIFGVHAPGIPEILFPLLNVLLQYHLPLRISGFPHLHALPLSIFIYGFPFLHALSCLDVILQTDEIHVLLLEVHVLVERCTQITHTL